MPRVFLDTNILAYDLDAGTPDKQRKARAALARPDHEFVISTQVLLELYVVLTRKLKPALPEPAAAEVITSLCRLPSSAPTRRLCSERSRSPCAISSRCGMP